MMCLSLFVFDAASGWIFRWTLVVWVDVATVVLQEKETDILRTNVILQIFTHLLLLPCEFVCRTV